MWPDKRMFLATGRLANKRCEGPAKFANTQRISIKFKRFDVVAKGTKFAQQIFLGHI
jgi:hypothetical protein